MWTAKSSSLMIAIGELSVTTTSATPEYQHACRQAGTGAPRTSKGLQESFLLAGEAALNPANHSIIEGTAPAGATLKLTKDFTTATSYDADHKFTSIPEHLETTLTVPADGHYVWHVDPSTRPVALIAKRTEAWTLSCGGQSVAVVVGMGQRVTQDLTC